MEGGGRGSHSSTRKETLNRGMNSVFAVIFVILICH